MPKRQLKRLTLIQLQLKGVQYFNNETLMFVVIKKVLLATNHKL